LPDPPAIRRNILKFQKEQDGNIPPCDKRVVRRWALIEDDIAKRLPLPGALLQCVKPLIENDVAKRPHAALRL